MTADKSNIESASLVKVYRIVLWVVTPFALLNVLGACSSTSPTSAPACSSLVDAEPEVGIEIVNSFSTVPSGGTIYDGVYALTAFRYLPISDITIAPASISGIFQFTGTVAEHVITFVGADVQRAVGKATLSESGAQLKLDYTCSRTGSETWSYSATESQVLMRIVTNKMIVGIPQMSSTGQVEFELTKQ